MDSNTQKQTRSKSISTPIPRNTTMATTNQSPNSFKQPGSIVQDMQKLITSLQDSIAPLNSLSSGKSADFSDDLSSPEWLVDMQIKLSELQGLTKELVKTGTLGEFVFFGRLPVELRTFVWEFSVSEPRILEVCYTGPSRRKELNHRIKINNPVPPTLHVCQESRAVALNKYSTLLDGMLLVGRTGPTGNPRFDPSSDVIFIPYNEQNLRNPMFFLGGWRSDFWSEEALAGLKNIAIDCRIWVHGLDVEEIMLTHFTGLETLTIVAHEAEWECEEGSKEYYADEIAFVDSTDSQYPSVVDLKLEVECELVSQKASDWAPDRWKVPKVFIKYLTRGGMKCCRIKQT